MMLSVVCFVFTVLLLILVHEAGHFFVARWCGVKVLRFSFGFGKALSIWRDARGTEYVWSLIPIGGYVKLLDEAEGPVSEALRPQAFNRQSMWKKIAIVSAGPLFNFVFAFLLLWVVSIVGITSFAPIIDHVTPGSISARAHLGASQEIIEINGHKTESWRDIHYVMMPLLGFTGNVSITLKSLQDGHIAHRTLSLADWSLDKRHSDLLESLGIVPWTPKIVPIVEGVATHSPAERAGLVKGDEILEVDTHPVTDWLMLVDYVKARPGANLTLNVRHEGQLHKVTVQLNRVDSQGTGLLGVSALPPKIPKQWVRIDGCGPVDAIGRALQQTVRLTSMTFVLIGRTVVGQLSLGHLSGPVGIAKAASDSVHIGLVYYLFFIALLSISIGVLNLLPIPMLDGGHLLQYAIEIIIRRPLSLEVKTRFAIVGMLFISVLTVVGLFNDLR